MAYDLSQNIQEAVLALTQKPLRATSAERFLIYDEIKGKNKDAPQPVRFARMLAELLDRVSTPVAPHDLIAGRCIDRELTADEEARFQAYLASPDYPHRAVIFNAGHCEFSWGDLACEGLDGMRNAARSALSATQSVPPLTFCHEVA